MSAHLQFQEIPGFAEACRRESEVRRRAWCHTHTYIAGVRVRFLTLRDTVILEEMRNGFFAPWRFDTDEEFLGHAAQLVWWLSDCRKPSVYSDRILQPLVMIDQQRLIRYLAHRPSELAAGVKQYLSDTYLDSPRGSNSNGRALAATPAYIADTLAAANLFESMDAVLDMPLVKLWQLLRMAVRRVYGVPLTNESDRIACDYLASLNEGKN